MSSPISSGFSGFISEPLPINPCQLDALHVLSQRPQLCSEPPNALLELLERVGLLLGNSRGKGLANRLTKDLLEVIWVYKEP